jgi:hypothetical protein
MRSKENVDFWLWMLLCFCSSLKYEHIGVYLRYDLPVCSFSDSYLLVLLFWQFNVSEVLEYNTMIWTHDMVRKVFIGGFLAVMTGWKSLVLMLLGEPCRNSLQWGLFSLHSKQIKVPWSKVPLVSKECSRGASTVFNCTIWLSEASERCW